MGDMGDDFRAMREYSQEKRASNRNSSAQILREEGINFESKNGDAHLIVTHAGRTVDFWPGTGKWIVRPGLSQGRGVFGLLRFLRRKP